MRGRRVFAGVVQPGQQFGRLRTVRKVERKRGSGEAERWHCTCVCGGTSITKAAMLLRGLAQSCGCLRREMFHRMGTGVTPQREGRRGKHVEMLKCNNCNESFVPEAEGLVLTTRGKTVSAVCGACCQDVRVGKLVIKKPEVGTFVYEQWQPVEMATSGLSSTKRVG